MSPTQFSSFLNGISKEPLYVLDKAIPLSQYTPIDLSESNSELQSFDSTNSRAWEHYITAYCKNKRAKVAFGGYTEKRNLYARSNYFNKQDKQTERNIHLGMDLWIGAGSTVYTPLDGVVHSFANNTNFGDYGPTIIVQHTISDIIFYTLYGHLSVASIQNLKVGQTFKAGDSMATLGDASVNGDYAPHLHFQIIRNIYDYYGDYPGVSSQTDLPFYLENCPDPNTLLKIQ